MQKKEKEMIGKLQDHNQTDIFKPFLIEFIDMNHELVLLAKKNRLEYFGKGIIGVLFR